MQLLYCRIRHDEKNTSLTAQIIYKAIYCNLIYCNVCAADVVFV